MACVSEIRATATQGHGSRSVARGVGVAIATAAPTFERHAGGGCTFTGARSHWPRCFHSSRSGRAAHYSQGGVEGHDLRPYLVLWPNTGRSEERRVGKSVSVRVDLGGRRIIKKTKIIKNNS